MNVTAARTIFPLIGILSVSKVRMTGTETNEMIMEEKENYEKKKRGYCDS